MYKALIREQIEAAKNEMGAAESVLDRILGEIQVAPRAQKTAVTSVVEDAFARLRAARMGVSHLEELLTAEGA